MSIKIDSLMNVIAECRAAAIADRLMLQSLLQVHPHPDAVAKVWSTLQGLYRLEEGSDQPNFDRALDAVQAETFSAWDVRLAAAAPTPL